MDIEARLRKILKDFDETIDVEGITGQTRLREDLDLSSVSMLYIAVTLEEEFGVDFSEVDLGKLRTVGDIVDTIANAKKE